MGPNNGGCECCQLPIHGVLHAYPIGFRLNIGAEADGSPVYGTVERHIWSDSGLAAGYEVRLSDGSRYFYGPGFRRSAGNPAKALADG